LGFWPNYFEGALGFVRKSRGFVFYCNIYDNLWDLLPSPILPLCAFMRIKAKHQKLIFKKNGDYDEMKMFAYMK
jgi:hypothetical protein